MLKLRKMTGYAVVAVTYSELQQEWTQPVNEMMKLPDVMSSTVQLNK